MNGGNRTAWEGGTRLFLCLLALLTTSLAAEQAAIVPLPDLYRQMDARQEWVVLPLADWQALRDQARTLDEKRPPVTAPDGAWLEHGTVAVTVVDDRELRCTATLTAVSLHERPRRCPLFAALPARVGAPTLGAGPALLVPHDGGADVLLPGAGRHTLTVTWSTTLDGGDEAHRIGTLALPLMAGCALTVRSATSGLVDGPLFAARPDGTWTLAGPVASLIPFHWLPGRDRQPQAMVLGVAQQVAVRCTGDERLLTWSADLTLHRGSWPTGLDLRLPTGWRFVSPGAGVTGISERRDGVHLDLADGVKAIACTGWCPADAAIALPAVAQALVQGGRVELSATRPLDYVLPTLWRVTDAAEGRRVFAVPGPDAGMRVVVVDDAVWPVVTSTAQCTLGPTPGRWRLTASLTIGACDRFSLPVRLPAGWRLRRFTGDDDLRIDGLAPGDENPAGAAVRDATLTARAGFRKPRQLLGELERAATTVDTVEPLQVPGARRSDLHLGVQADAGIATTIAAPPMWRLEEQDQVFMAIGAGHERPEADTVRTRLQASGTVEPVRITATVRPPTCTVEAVVSLQPGRERTWCRCDLRIAVTEGHADGFTVTIPFAAPPVLTQAAGPVRWELGTEGGAWRLRSNQPWQGERLLRLEGALTAGTDARHPFIVPGVALEGGPAIPLRLLTVLHAAADGDVLVERGGGWRDADVDDLPTWSGLIPGEAVVAVLRRLPDGGADGSWRVEQRPTAHLPGAFIDRLELRTRVAADGHRTLARFRLAAPDLQALALGLPAGSRLVEATIDGETVPPRRHDDDLDLPLPGRTQVQVALLYAQDATPARLLLVPPRLGGLPVTRSAWTVGVDGELCVRAVASPDAMPVTADGPHWTRLPFTPWQAPSCATASPGRQSGTLFTGTALAPTAPPADDAPGDPRALQAPPVATPPRGEPELELPAQRLAGNRLGGAAPLLLAVEAGEELRRADRWGVALALLLAVLLAGLGRGRVACAAIILAPALAAALHGWHLLYGPWLACGEWLAPLLLAALLLQRLRLRLHPTPTVVSAALLLLVALLPAGEAPVLMGYERIDEAGLPQGVRVAMPRDRFTALWNRAHPAPDQVPAVCALATGAPLIELQATPGSMAGELRLAFAVPGDVWQSLILPLPPGLVRSCSAAALGPAPVPAIAWRRGDQGLILDLPPRSQGLVTVALELPVNGREGRWTATLPLAPLPGGSLRMRCDPAWRLTVDDADGSAGEATVRCWDLPAQGGAVTLVLRRAAAATVADAPRPTLDQRLAVRLLDDRLAWQATVACTGLTERRLTVALPAGLVLTGVEGAGLADWRQDGRSALLSWRDAATRRSVVMNGLIPRPGNGSCACAVAVEGAVRSTGRVDLSHGGGARFQMPATTTLTRDHPAAGADLALRWEDDPARLVLGWQADAVELRGSPRSAIVVGLDQVLCQRSLRIAGRGTADALVWALPEPWQWDQSEAAATTVLATVLGSGAERRVAVRSPRGAWRAGDTVSLRCSAGRRELGARILLPDAVPTAPGLVVERARWLVGGAGDGRLRLEDAQALEPQPIAGSESGMPAMPPFANGERWLFAGLATAHAPVLVEEHVAPQVEVTADHYLVLAQDRLRWWARLDYVVKAGALDELRCTLPAGARLTALRTRDLGSWRQEGGLVVARLSAPARTTHVLELDLELPLQDGAAQVTAATMPWPTGRCRVALVDEDGTGLVHLDPQGLEAADERDAGGLPPGIAADAVPNRWRSERAGWSLGVRRETVGEAGGADGVVTLVDGTTAVAPDGESRSRAVWHLLNRTRTRLALEIPAGVELWEVQVDGRPVRPREDATTAASRTVHIPVTPLRPGAAATRLALTWRGVPAGDGRVHLRPPHFSGVTVVQVAWRCTAPAGWRLQRRSGLETVEDVAVANLRVQRVLDDVARLNRLANLSDNGLRRQAEELTVLDQELNDHLVALERLGTGSQDSTQEFQRQTAVQQRAEVSKARANNSGVYGSRSGRRQKLQIDNLQLNWYANEAPAPAVVAAAGGLGPGQPPPGWRAAGGGALLGVELLPEQPGRILALRGQGGDLATELVLEQDAGPRWPWLALVGGVVLACGVFLVRRGGVR